MSGDDNGPNLDRLRSVAEGLSSWRKSHATQDSESRAFEQIASSTDAIVAQLPASVSEGLRRRIEAMTLLGSELERQLQTVRGRERKNRGELGFAQSELERSQRHVVELEAERDRLVEENDHLNAQVDQLGHAVPAPPGQLLQFEAEMNMARELISGLEVQCARYEKRISHLTQEVERHRAISRALLGRRTHEPTPGSDGDT